MTKGRLRLALGITFLALTGLVIGFWNPEKHSELEPLKVIVVFTGVGQFIVLAFRMSKRVTDFLDYPYYIIIGVGVSIAFSLNSDRLNQVNLEIATDNLNKHGDYIFSLCGSVESIKESPNLIPLKNMCGEIIEKLPRISYWVGMAGTEKDFITKTEFPADTSNFEPHSNVLGFMLDLRPDFLAMAKTETDQIARDLLYAADRMRELLYERQSAQSTIIMSETDYPSDLSSIYLAKWIYILGFVISLKLMKTTNGLFPGRSI